MCCFVFLAHSPVNETLMMESDDQSVNVTVGAVSDVFPFPPHICACCFSPCGDVAPSISVLTHRAMRMLLHQSFMTEEQFKHSGFQNLATLLLMVMSEGCRSSKSINLFYVCCHDNLGLIVHAVKLISHYLQQVEAEKCHNVVQSCCFSFITIKSCLSSVLTGKLDFYCFCCTCSSSQ